MSYHMKLLFFSSCFFLTFSLFGQDISGSELLEKSITYHDPSGNWDTFNGAFNVTMETPNNSPRLSEIKINLPEEFFQVTATRDTIITEYSLNQGACTIKLNGKEDLSEATIKRKQS